MQGLALRCLAVALSTASPAFCQKLVAADGDASDWFGYHVATDQDFAVVGAPGEDEDGPQAGAAYVYRQGTLGWQEVAKLTPSNGVSERCFGWSVAVSGERVAVGSPGEVGPGRPQGRVHVFDLIAGQWVQVAELLGSNGSSGDGFGCAVALEGDTLVVGAYLDDEAGSDAGAVYVFGVQSGSWVQTGKIWAPDATGEDFFGYALDVSGETLLIGAYSDDDGATNSGSAYTFERTFTGWLFDEKLHAPNPGLNDLFGRTLSLDGDRALVGNPHSDVVADGAGAAHVFLRTGPTWQLESTLLAPDGAVDDAFGHSVSLLGDLAIVGAPNDDDQGPNSGSIWVYSHAGDWQVATKWVPKDGEPYDCFGLSLDLGNGVVVSSFLHDATALDAGAVYPRAPEDLVPTWWQPYCFCEVGPCNNVDPLRGCANVTGLGSLLTAAGTTSVSADDLTLTVSGLPPFTFGVMLMAGIQDQAPLGDGLRCLGLGPDGIHRHAPMVTGSLGSIELGPGIVALSQGLPGAADIYAGSTWHFQAWYRDTLGPCATGSNLTNAMTVTFQP
jgi:hypothetical protein